MKISKEKYEKLHEQQTKLGISANAFADKIGIKRSTYYGGLKRAGLTPTETRKVKKLESKGVRKKKMRNVLKRIDPTPHTIQIPDMIPERKKEMSVFVIKGDADDVLKVLQQMF